MQNTSQRYALIEWLRFIAIILMVIYHLSFDLVFTQVITWQQFNHPIMLAIGRTCLCTFLFCVGYSMAVANQHGINFQKNLKRVVKISLAAGLVSLATYLPERFNWVAEHQKGQWIYFGILHHIAAMSIIGLLFLKIPRIALILGLSICSFYLYLYLSQQPFVSFLYKLAEDYQLAGSLADFINFDRRPSLDYIAIFPWGGMVLIGIGAHRFAIHQHFHFSAPTLVRTCSKHSLLIYLIHQPILFPIAWCISLL